MPLWMIQQQQEKEERQSYPTGGGGGRSHHLPPPPTPQFRMLVRPDSQSAEGAPSSDGPILSAVAQQAHDRRNEFRRSYPDLTSPDPYPIQPSPNLTQPYPTLPILPRPNLTQPYPIQPSPNPTSPNLTQPNPLPTQPPPTSPNLTLPNPTLSQPHQA